MPLSSKPTKVKKDLDSLSERDRNFESVSFSELDETGLAETELAETEAIFSDSTAPLVGHTTLPVKNSLDWQPAVSPLVQALSIVETPEPSLVVPSLEAVSWPNDLPDELVSGENSVGLFPVGLNVGNRNVLPSFLIKGTEANTSMAELGSWVLPFDSTLQALGFTIGLLESGDWEVRSPGLVTRISPSALTTDSDLGLSISIEQIEAQLGITATFNQSDYAIITPAIK